MIRCDPIVTAPTARSCKATRTPPIVTLKHQHSAHVLMPPCNAATRNTDSLHTYKNDKLLLRNLLRTDYLNTLIALTQMRLQQNHTQIIKVIEHKRRATHMSQVPTVGWSHNQHMNDATGRPMWHSNTAARAVLAALSPR
jgi:hypothetical protein